MTQGMKNYEVNIKILVEGSDKISVLDGVLRETFRSLAHDIEIGYGVKEFSHEIKKVK